MITHPPSSSAELCKLVIGGGGNGGGGRGGDNDDNDDEKCNVRKRAEWAIIASRPPFLVELKNIIDDLPQK